MRRFVVFLLLALAAAHAVAATAVSRSDDPLRTELRQLLERGGPDRHRAAYFLAGLELRTADGDAARAMRLLERAAAGGYLPAMWLLARRKLLGGGIGPVEVIRDRDGGCALLARILKLRTPASASADGRPMADPGVSARSVATAATLAARLAAKHCDTSPHQPS